MPRFEESFTLEERTNESKRIRTKYPDRIAIIAQPAPGRGKDFGDVDISKSRYLVPGHLTCGQISFVLRRRLKFPPEKALFIFCGKEIPPTSMLLKVLYLQNKSEDGFLYLDYSSEDTFG